MSADGEFLGWPKCDRCGGPVTDPRKASLSMNTAARWRQLDESKAWRKAKKAEKLREAEEEGKTSEIALALAAATWTTGELAEDPAWPPEPWLWAHDRCTDHRQDYEISGERLDTLGKVLDWTLHLADKGWWDNIAWKGAVRRFWRLPQA